MQRTSEAVGGQLTSPALVEVGDDEQIHTTATVHCSLGV